MAHLLSKGAEQVSEALNSLKVDSPPAGKLLRVKDMVPTAYHCALMALVLADAPEIFIDESVKDDSTANGSRDQPYSSLLAAYTAKGTSELNPLVRKAPTAEEPNPEFAPASASAIKKAKRVHETNVRKAAKNAETAKKNEEKDAARAEIEAQKLEDARKVVLDKPDAPATKIKIKDAVSNRGSRVTVQAWVHRLRNQGGLVFVVLRDGTGYLQCVLGGKLVGDPIGSYLYFITDDASHRCKPLTL